MANVSTTVEARNQLSEVIDRVACGKERVILTRRGKALVAVVPIEDVRLLEELDSRLDLEEVRAALAEAKGQGTIPWEQLKSDLGP